MVWSGVEWCGVVWSGVEWGGMVWNGVEWFNHSVNSGFFDTRLKILTPAPLVVLVTNIRYGYMHSHSDEALIFYIHLCHILYIFCTYLNIFCTYLSYSVLDSIKARYSQNNWIHRLTQFHPFSMV